MTTTASAKRELRLHTKSKLSNISPEQLSQQSQTAQSLILSHPRYKAAKRLSIYLSMPTAEVQTDTIVRNALERGKKVFVPFIHDSRPRTSLKKDGKVMEMDMLHLHSLAEFESLERDSWGIPSLPSDGVDGRENAMGGFGASLAVERDVGSAGEGGLHLVILPGVAFDRGLRRLGHGKGFYDRFLERGWGLEWGRGRPWIGE